MANTVKRIRPPIGWTAADLLALLGANAKVHVQRAATETGSFADIVAPLITIQTGVEEYNAPDPAGLSSSWYRVRFESNDGLNVTDWKTQPAEYA